MARGKLRIYLGAAPGVGKTYAMLDEGWRRRQRGTDVVAGFVETYDRPKTQAQLRDLEVVPRKKMTYRGQEFEELDIDALLARRPAVALVDELAHTNVPGSRNEKRWQDVQELLDVGVTVISTLNIQHLASVTDVVESITGVVQREIVPDDVVRAADQIELVDMSPDALRRRMAHGNIYKPEKVDSALANYFRAGNLGALRELALLWVADRVDDELQQYRERHGIDEPWETKERVVVAISGAPGGDNLLRRGARMANRVNGELVGVYARTTSGFTQAVPGDLERQRAVLEELGGRYAEVTGADVATSLVAFARAENATQLVLGSSRRSRWAEMTTGSIVSRVVRSAAPTDVHVISSSEEPSHGLPHSPRRRHLAEVAPRRRAAGWVLGTVGIALGALALSTLRSSIGLQGALLFLLLGVVCVAIIGGVLPAVAATVIAGLTADYFFTRPYHSLRIAQVVDLVAVVSFLVIAAIVSVLVDLLTRRGQQVVRAQAESEALARLAGGSGLAREALPDLVGELRRTFDVDSVAILAPGADGWRVLAAAGSPPPTRPEDAAFSAELAEGTVLVLSDAGFSGEDARLLRAFVTQLRLTQERALLESRAETAVELEKANSLRAAILAAVSHDLRTPLAAIKAAATSVLSHDVDWSGAQVDAFAKTINSEADRLTQLVSNLLDMSRLQAGAVAVALRPVKVDDLLYETVEALGSLASAVVVDAAESLPLVSADAGLLERALANVIENAIAWSPEGVAVRVEAGNAGSAVAIRVIDQGPGIPPDQREEVFRPFQRLGDGAGNRPNGVGLGLAVARGFVEAIGGELTLEDTPGGGTTAVFSLERADAS
jgi:two-component system, OmpR family, sensor histidine kinase KdpD